MSEQEVRQAFEQYRDKAGLIQPVINPGQDASGNGLLYTAEYVLALHKLKLLTVEDCHKFLTTVYKCMLEPGLLKRSPTHTDQQGLDDYVGVMAALYVTRRWAAADSIHKYGKDHWWVYNNSQPGTIRHKDGRINWSAMFFRMPQVIAHFKWATNRTPNLFERLYWFGTIIVASRAEKKNQDAWVLSYLLIQVMDRRSLLCTLAAEIWEMQFRKHYPGGLGEVLGSYFNNTEHPLCVHFPKE